MDTQRVSSNTDTADETKAFDATEAIDAAEAVDATDAIAKALRRLRGRRQHQHQHQHQTSFRPSPHLRRAQAQPGQSTDDHGSSDRRRHHRGELASMRMLEALAAATEPLSVSDIGEAIGVDQPRASRLVQQAVERGAVRREADPADARRTRIALSADGRAIVLRVASERRAALEHSLTDFTPHERKELARLLTKLADNWQFPA